MTRQNHAKLYIMFAVKVDHKSCHINLRMGVVLDLIKNGHCA